MGIVNVTPDSFSDGGSFANVKAAVDHGLRLVEEGADMLDIGGESTRPGSDPVPVAEELRRVIPVLEGLRIKTDARISVDTRKAEVMRQAAAAGADILNDVSALTHDPAALGVAAESGLPVILMHAQGDPKTMNDNPQYSDVALDVFIGGSHGEHHPPMRHRGLGPEVDISWTAERGGPPVRSCHRGHGVRGVPPRPGAEDPRGP
jgi:dihydropteroate synthase